MKQMILTGLATEQTFTSNGEAQFFLVFNNGELKVPTTEAAAQIVVQAMYGATKVAEQHEAEEEQPLPEEDVEQEAEPEEELEEEEMDEPASMNGSGDGIVDEDGIAQI